MLLWRISSFAWHHGDLSAGYILGYFETNFEIAGSRDVLSGQSPGRDPLRSAPRPIAPPTWLADRKNKAGRNEERRFYLRPIRTIVIAADFQARAV